MMMKTEEKIRKNEWMDRDQKKFAHNQPPTSQVNKTLLLSGGNETELSLESSTINFNREFFFMNRFPASKQNTCWHQSCHLSIYIMPKK